MRILLNADAVKASLISAAKKKARSEFLSVFVYLDKKVIASTDGKTLFISKPGLYVSTDTAEYNSKNYIAIKVEDLETFTKTLKHGYLEVKEEGGQVYLSYNGINKPIELAEEDSIPLDKVYNQSLLDNSYSTMGINAELLERVIKITKLLDDRKDFKFPTFKFSQQTRPFLAVIGDDKAHLLITPMSGTKVNHDIKLFEIWGLINESLFRY